MSQLQVFQNNDFGRVRIILVDDDPWFIGKDVANALDYDQTNNMIKRLDDEDFISSKLEGMNMESILINESGLYTAVLGSNLPTAKKFKRWVTSEIIPSIRKTGTYSINHHMSPLNLDKLPSSNEDVLYTVAEVAKLIKSENH